MLNENNFDMSKSYEDQCIQEPDWHASIAQTLPVNVLLLDPLVISQQKSLQSSIQSLQNARDRAY